eukprot:CAMPEP_0206488576 /NCGR_PEP_ID=MMETSP0324_2-20121206/42530_1 /ASSEMBLY_ACC=CAM_ASM_000836 /TAXON_ID=2866 /ORGANISM="Crypthecodinium cohnii, Strain Seligo" /LENGTH=1115 /DNA_ID=CAMNT_0053967697 /DNA_START=95 /DNA_END=3442 /DNA_ORIENTATION=-
MAEFVGTLRALLGSDNNSRGAAEKTFSDAREQQPAATVAALFHALGESSLEEPVREQAAVLLRQCLSKIQDDNSTWQKLGAQGQSDAKAKLLQLLQSEASDKVRRKIADAIQKLGCQLIEIPQDTRPNNAEAWPELMPTLMPIVVDTSRPDGLRADTLLAVKELLDSIWPVMVANINQTLGVLQTCFSSNSPAVMGRTSELLCELLDKLDKKEERSKFAPLLEELCRVIRALADSPNIAPLNDLLTALQAGPSLADFLKDAFPEHVLPLLKTIATSHKEEDINRAALEAVMTIVEAKPKAYSKNTVAMQAIIEICVVFMTQLESDMAGWAAEDDEEGDDEERLIMGKEVLDRLCRCMHAHDKMAPLMELMKQAVSSLMAAGWKEQCAGLSMLATIIEFVDDEDLVQTMFGVVKSNLKSQHERVRHTAWAAVAQFAEDHAETLSSEAIAPGMLEAFLAVMDDPCERVQSRSMEAFQFYGGLVEREVLDPFVPNMMSKLGHKLQHGSIGLQRKTITYIAVLAGQMEDGFADYYAPLMPVLKQLVQSLVHKNEERTLLGKAFECISLLASTVGLEVFRSDAEVIMEAMIKATNVPDLTSNDPIMEYMMQASQRICFVMKGAFLPFLPHILPLVLKKFTLAPKEYSKETMQSIKDDEEVSLTVQQGEDGKVKVILMSTSELEDLKGAIGCVHTFVEELGKLFVDYLQQTAQALLLVFDFALDEDVRDLAFETWGLLCQCARESGQVDKVGELVQEFLKRMLPKFEQVGATGSVAEAQGIDSAALKTAANGVTACLRKAGPGVLSGEQLNHICQVALKALHVSLQLRDAEEEANRRNQKNDEEEEMVDDEELEEATKFRLALCEMVGALAVHHGDLFMEHCLNPSMQLVTKFIQPSVRWEDRRLALFVICDILEHLKEKAVPAWPHFMEQLLQDVAHQSTALRQPACYAVSLAAQVKAFAQFAPSAATTLSQVISQTRQAGKKKSQREAQACADNALSALVEILTTHQQAVAGAEGQLWSVWLNALPIQVDEVEGVKNHRTLLNLVKAEHPQVIGESGGNLPQVLSILVDVYKSNTVDEETSKGIAQLVVQLGPQRLEGIASQLKEKHRKKLLRIHKEGQ